METKKNQLVGSIFAYLNENANYAVLRNYEGLPDSNQSRDIDIIISKKELHKHKSAIIDVIEKSGWRIITYLNSDRLITYVCGYCNRGTIEVIQLDFFINTSVFGILLMDADEFLKGRQFNGRIYHVGKEAEFLDKYLYDRAVGTPYPEKYRAVRETVKDLPLVAAKLKAVFGKLSVEETDKASGKRLLLHVLKYNLFRRPLALLRDVFLFVVSYTRNYICSNTGFSIGFTGPDGSGKTTVLTEIIQSFGVVFDKAHVLYHFRPMMFGNLGEIAHSAGLTKSVDREYENPHRGSKTSLPSSFFRLFYYSADYVLGYFAEVKRVKRITRLVFFDRYYTDIITDSRRSRIFLNYKFLYWFGKLFIPKLDYNILLTADSDVILSRKQELDLQGINTINEKMDYLSNKKGYYLVKNNGMPEECVAKILSIIFEEQHKKNLKRK